MEKKTIILFNRYLSGAATKAEKEELLAWIAGNQEFQKRLEEEFVSPVSGEPIDEQQKKELLNTIRQRIMPRRMITLGFSTLMRIAAMIIFPLMIAGLAYLYFSGTGETVQYTTVEVERGQKSNVILPDGSKVFINSESQLVYSSGFNRKERKLKLKGEAYFEVAKNQDLPFIVDAGWMSVHAIGTSFNISSYPEDSIVYTTLTEGKVKVDISGHAIFMNPDEQMYLDAKNGQYTVRKLDDAKLTIGWLNNQLSFENVSFVELVSTLNRIYNTNIYISSESLKKQRFTGVIKNNSLESVLRILSLTAPVRYEIKEKCVELHSVN